MDIGKIMFDKVVEDAKKLRAFYWESLLNEYYKADFDSLEDLREVIKELKKMPEQFLYTAEFKLASLRQEVISEGICPVCGRELKTRETYKATSTSPAEYALYCPAGCNI